MITYLKDKLVEFFWGTPIGCIHDVMESPIMCDACNLCNREAAQFYYRMTDGVYSAYCGYHKWARVTYLTYTRISKEHFLRETNHISNF